MSIQAGACRKGNRYRAKRVKWVWAFSYCKSPEKGLQWKSERKRTRNPGIVEPLTSSTPKCELGPPMKETDLKIFRPSTPLPSTASGHSLWLYVRVCPAPAPGEPGRRKRMEPGLGTRPTPKGEAEQPDG